MVILPWWMNAAWDWFWYYRRDKIKYRVWNQGDGYIAMAATKSMSVWNCYGGTQEKAIEMATYRLNEALAEKMNSE